VLKAMEADSGSEIKELRVDGGASVDDLLMQTQADILKTTVVRPSVTETTAMGAAYLAGLAVGYWNSIDEIEQQWKIECVFQPSNNKVDGIIEGWHKAIKAAKYWAEL